MNQEPHSAGNIISNLSYGDIVLHCWQNNYHITFPNKEHFPAMMGKCSHMEMISLA